MAIRVFVAVLLTAVAVLGQGRSTPPEILSKVEPQYSAEARTDGVQGTVVLQCDIGRDGRAHNIQVVQPLNSGLDQKAVEAVTGWTFKPGTKAGHPVTWRRWKVPVQFVLPKPASDNGVQTVPDWAIGTGVVLIVMVVLILIGLRMAAGSETGPVQRKSDDAHDAETRTLIEDLRRGSPEVPRQSPPAPFSPQRGMDLSAVPERFVIFDLETTGLSPTQHEIIEIGAIKVNSTSNFYETFQMLVKPKNRIPKMITRINGISQEMVDRDGEPLEQAIREFSEFIGSLPLVAFNASFDMSFLQTAANRHGFAVGNRYMCALEMARRAWPGRSSYKLPDLARDGHLSDEDTHRALGDCKRTLVIFTAAASRISCTGAPTGRRRNRRRAKSAGA